MSGRARSGALGLVLLLASTMAACSGGAPGAATGGATPIGGAAGGGGNPGASIVAAAGGPLASVVAGAIGGMPDIDPCSMIGKSDVQALFSAQLGDPTTDHMGTCEFHLADPSLGDGLNVYVTTGSNSREPYDTNMGPVGSSGVQALSGLGDQAKWTLLAGYFPMVESYKGQVGCELTAAGGNGQLKVATTGKAMFAVIDPAALDGFIARFGALCNQVFAANPPGQ